MSASGKFRVVYFPETGEADALAYEEAIKAASPPPAAVVDKIVLQEELSKSRARHSPHCGECDEPSNVF